MRRRQLFNVTRIRYDTGWMFNRLPRVHHHHGGRITSRANTGVEYSWARVIVVADWRRRGTWLSDKSFREIFTPHWRIKGHGQKFQLGGVKRERIKQRRAYPGSCQVIVILSVRLSVCLGKLVINAQTVQDIEIHCTPHDRAVFLVYWCQISWSSIQGWTQTSVLRQVPLAKAKIWPTVRCAMDVNLN